jgi:peroxiredoxin (alkyl hydroperoxide reductase subunit C)
MVEHPKNNGGIEGVTYPILADTNRNLSNILGISISILQR